VYKDFSHAQTHYVEMLAKSGKSALGLLIVAHAQTQYLAMLPNSVKCAPCLYIVAPAQTLDVIMLLTCFIVR
jgi:hypothetical protein